MKKIYIILGIQTLVIVWLVITQVSQNFTIVESLDTELAIMEAIEVDRDNFDKLENDINMTTAQIYKDLESVADAVIDLEKQVTSK